VSRNLPAMTASLIRRPLTTEIGDARSPVRQFFNERFTVGLPDVQRRYRENSPSQVVPSVSRSDANPRTLGTAADWLLRFLLHPSPAPDLAVKGVAGCRSIGIDMAPAFIQIAKHLGVRLPKALGEVRVFTGPGPGSAVEAELLARSCWALALLSEVQRGGPQAAMGGPLGQFRNRTASGADLLALCPSAGLDQLAQFRRVFETALIPRLATRPGLWAVGPTFTGSKLIKADADLVAEGLLLELKTHSKPSLLVTDLFQVIGYWLLDFGDAYRVTKLGIFAARYGYLVAWGLDELLGELAGHEVDLHAARDQFRHLLEYGTGRSLD